MCITEGTFRSPKAIFVASDGDQRVVLLLNILQKDQALAFSLLPLTSVRKLA